MCQAEPFVVICICELISSMSTTPAVVEDNIQVFARVRSVIGKTAKAVEVDEKNGTIVVGQQSFKFDHVGAPTITQVGVDI